MTFRLRAVVLAAAGILAVGSDAAFAFGGGARIVVRQNSHYGHGGNGQFMNGLLQLGQTVLQSPLVNGNSQSAGIPPASQLPTQNQDIKRVLDRLDVLNGVTPKLPSNPGPLGGQINNVPAGAGYPARYPR
ncbi:MAG: hypothetical protein ABL888_20120 [Pirellulaceae bacterium]